MESLPALRRRLAACLLSLLPMPARPTLGQAKPPPSSAPNADHAALPAG